VRIRRESGLGVAQTLSLWMPGNRCLRALLLLPLASLYGACAQPMTGHSSPIVVAMDCASEPTLIVYRTGRDNAVLLVRGEAYSLAQARSASGARYVSTSGIEVEWWN